MVSSSDKGSSCTTSFISGSMLTVGLRAHPVWKMSEGLEFAIAPTNCRLVYIGGVLK